MMTVNSAQLNGTVGESHLIIGAGEVGTGLYKHLLTQKDIQVSIIDKESVGFRSSNVLHICFPYSNNFIAQVQEYQLYYMPILTVIHSTTPVGTVKKIENAVHMPLEGKHPRLWEAFSTFLRIVGVNNQDDYKAVERHIKPLFEQGIHIVYDTDKTELMKLLSTGLRYPAMIALAQEQERICKEHGFSYEEIVSDYDKVYNAGYQKLGYPQYTRPLLTPGFIGGHCVMHNLELLDIDKESLVLWIKQSNALKANEYHD